ncbi:unnamed protein product [Tilletia controversa]|uniref:Uncharacterized protein n=3 Tax=Tilletia TaxID=13289 RepID=A0A8X7MW92_9BASI|nr:hypothetical protein CF336_g2151 [Tilletia laevis]KAE8202779.1 hypothetical protein CF328_g2024 [Tilletia controversa]KAE8263486.1 hypothetical protein A4X03_0g1649 [Tilletia caries]KAE8207057.1 hypothetical protein CF335_g1427 [Tilletia laevis]KAE8251828.1 hypothetical protein A4X06_0g2518 [Tilletia controversa]
MARSDAHYRRGPSAHSPTSRFLALAADGGSTSATLSEAAAGEPYTFPPLFLDPDRTAAHENEFGNPDEHSVLWALPALQYETIAVPEGLIPPAIDTDADVLPSEQHPSFPYGNPFAGVSSQVNTPFASRPLLDPKLHLNLELAHAAESRSRIRNEDPPLDDAFANLGNTGIQGAGLVPTAASADGGGPSAQDHVLAHHLQLRAATAHGLSNPHWPFRRFGPGRLSSSSPSGGAGALLRAERERIQSPVREVWADLALEALLPRGKVLPFQHTVASGGGQRHLAASANRAEGDPLHHGLQAPDRVGMPVIPGAPPVVRPPPTFEAGGRATSTLREDYLDPPSHSGSSVPPSGTTEERLARAMALTGVRDYVDTQPSSASSSAAPPAEFHSTTSQDAVRQAAARMRGLVSRTHRQQHQHLRPAESQGQGTGPWPFVLPQPLR